MPQYSTTPVITSIWTLEGTRVIPKRLIVVAVIAIGIIAAIAYVIIQRNNNPQVSKVTNTGQVGQTVTPQPQQQNAATTQPTDQDFIDSIKQASPSLFSSQGTPDFGIVQTTQPVPGWYVVKISLSGAQDGSGYVVFQQTSNPNNPYPIAYNDYSSNHHDSTVLPQPIQGIIGASQ